MEYVRLGRTGLKVSRLCLGAMSYGDPAWRQWVLPEAESRPFFERALERGINFFDTADMYSLGRSEEILGRALRTLAPREEVVVATKVFYPVGEGPNARGLSRQHVLDAADASLRRLGRDHIDLYQIHRWDPETPIDETLEALHDLIRWGKVRYIGASSMYAWQFALALYRADRGGWSRFVSMQNHYNLLYREEEREMIPLCREEGIAILPWSPLARGVLAGTWRAGEAGKTARGRSDGFTKRLYTRAADYAIVDHVADVARARDATPAQVALAWLLQRPGVTAPIIGATKLEHLDQLLDALDLQLTPDECDQLESLYEPHPVLGHE